MKIENMKNYTDYNDWIESNYLTSDFTDEEINDLYEMCTKNKSFEIDEWKLIKEHCKMVEWKDENFLKNLQKMWDKFP